MSELIAKMVQNGVSGAPFWSILGFPPSGGSAQASLQCSANRRLIRAGCCSCNLAGSLSSGLAADCQFSRLGREIARTTAASYEAPVCLALQHKWQRANTHVKLLFLTPSPRGRYRPKVVDSGLKRSKPAERFELLPCASKSSPNPSESITHL